MRSRLEVSEGWVRRAEEWCRDRAYWSPDAGHLPQLAAEWIAVLHAEVEACSAPSSFVALHSPDTPPMAIPLAIASNLAAAGAERLALAEQLVFGFVAAVHSESLSLAALSARAMLELAADTRLYQGRIDRAMAALERESLRKESTAWPELLSAVRDLRYGGRLHPLDGALRTNALTAVDKLGGLIREVYDVLSEICHPNVEAGAQYWRLTDSYVMGLPVIAFSPTGGESPHKVDAFNGPRLVTMVIVPFARTMLRHSVVIAFGTDVGSEAQSNELGLPLHPGRNDPCPCRSGIKFKSCGHPDPPLPPPPPSEGLDRW